MRIYNQQTCILTGVLIVRHCLAISGIFCKYVAHLVDSERPSTPEKTASEESEVGMAITILV